MIQLYPPTTSPLVENVFGAALASPSVRSRGSSRVATNLTHGQGLLGTSTEELADHFCDFLALNQLKDCAKVNLKTVSHPTASTSSGDVVSYDP
jgi:hypothetical protein